MKNLTTKIFLIVVLVAGFSVARAQTFTQLQQACNHNGILVLTIPAGTPSYTYQWYNNGNNPFHTSNSTSDTLFNYDGGDVYCIYTLNGNTSYSGNFYSPPFTYTITSTTNTCPVPSTASCNVTGAVSPYTVTWYNAGTTNVVATGTAVTLGAGPYGVEISDANGCLFGSNEQSDSVYVFQNSPIALTTTFTAANCTNGSASVLSATGGIAPYSYIWSTGASGAQINNLSTGSYNTVVTDAQGCSVMAYFYIPQGITINANPVTTSATCLQNNGSVISFGSGGVPPYNYVYSSGQTTQSATGLTTGNYYVQASDVNGCVGTDYFFINSSTPITVTYTASQSLCTAPTGSATLNISGGQAPYTINWATSPGQTGTVLNNVYGGVYFFSITDANGCVQSGAANVPSVSNMASFEWATASSCPGSTGSANVSAWTNNPPLTYSWSTGGTTASIGGLAPGGYNCTITDAMGCQLNKSLVVTYIAPINVGFLNTPSTCIFRNDGSINLSVSGGTSPYTYSWSNGQNTQNIANLAGDTMYWVTVTDVNGCSSCPKWTYLGTNFQNDSCYCTVIGTVYHDVNGNCLKDMGETNVHNILIKNNNTINNYKIRNYLFTDTAGIYSFILPTGNYNIQEVIQYMYPPSLCQSNNNPLSIVGSSGCTYTVDFANAINPLHDIHLMRAHLTLPVPGNSYIQQIIVQNDGTIPENSIELGYAHDGQMPFVNSSGINLIQPNSGLAPNWYAASNISLNPGQATSSIITYTVPTNIPLGTHVNFWDSAVYTPPMSNWLTDYSPWNNVNAFDTVVVGSFDPNMKEVSPKGVGPLGYITSNDTVLDYVIHFQNTGTYPAAKIVVVDTLDADLDWESLKPGYGNHYFTTEMDKNGVVTFTFNNIQLPPQYISEVGSIGMFCYSVHTLNNLPVGTQFKNSAAIFFDYNAPIYTNTTVNTINNSIGVSSVKSKDGQMILFPNPASENCTVKFNSVSEGSAALEIYSMTGALISSAPTYLKSGENTLSFSVGALSNGLYIVRLNGGTGMSTCKLSVNR